MAHTNVIDSNGGERERERKRERERERERERDHYFIISVDYCIYFLRIFNIHLIMECVILSTNIGINV